MDTKGDYVIDPEAPAVAAEAVVLPPVVERIKKALVTSRLTLASHSTGTDPYNSRRDRRRGSVWGNRKR